MEMLDVTYETGSVSVTPEVTPAGRVPPGHTGFRVGGDANSSVRPQNFSIRLSQVSTKSTKFGSHYAP